MKKILFGIFSLISFSFSQDFNLTGAGARAEGFGGAFIGLADDATAIVWNPAGLSQLERPEASLVTRYISESADFMYTLDPSLNGSVSQSYFSFNFGSIAYPIKSGIVAALAFQRQMDFYEDQKQQYYDDTQGATFTQESNLTGGVNTITPGISARISPLLSVGASVNIWTGNFTADQKLILQSSFGTDNITYTGDEDFSGVNFVFGGMIDLSGLQKPIPLKIGVSLKTPFTLAGEGSTNATSNGPVFGSGSQKSDVKDEVEMPMMLGFGASFKPNDNLTFAMDYEIRSYGDKTTISTETPTDPAGPSTTNPPEQISQSKNGLNQFRVGGEYLVIMDNGVIPLRVGFRTVPTVYADLKYNASNDQYEPTTNQVSGTGFSFGSGFISDAFALDITYGISSYTQKYDVDGEMKFSTGTLSSSVIIYF